MLSTQCSIFQQVSEIQVSYRNEVPAYQRPKIICSDDAYRILLQHWDEDQLDYCEKFKMVLLNRANLVLGIVTVSSGGVSGTVADPKMIFGAAMKANSSSILLAHYVEQVVM
ncbi:JAB domain-containing protein [Tunicatimonas pelagia]|uniref:JAB domain-containing protein n=1 Tax=Tunicatimonas pelagia TaxID=931531 RepID=UPI00266525FC|nr:JAB domain-containing protein [Tunicatimonas pelagia]WKN44244.1 JAB domain-containing protein [Tunicatimonas pelagia]